jgi:AraC-like DNA-binding protein
MGRSCPSKYVLIRELNPAHCDAEDGWTLNMASNLLKPQTYFGGQLRLSRSCSNITMSEVEYVQARECKGHSHERAFFALLLQGGYDEIYKRRRLRYRSDTVVFRPAGMTHADEITARGTRFFIIEMGDAWESRMREYSPRLDLTDDVCGDNAAWFAQRLYDAMTHSPACPSLLVQAMVLDLLNIAARSGVVRERQRPRWLGGVLELMHSDFSKNLKLEAIASQAGVHPAYLSRVFRKIYGESLGHYVNRLRVRYASAELTKQNGAPLCEVALTSGFADQSHFTRIFKQIAGVTPGAFRSRTALPYAGAGGCIPLPTVTKIV